jgi:hypothetical protein
LIFGNPATRRKFLKQIAGTSEAITLGPRLLGNFHVAFGGLENPLLELKP